jgi:hypothetical protein
MALLVGFYTIQDDNLFRRFEKTCYLSLQHNRTWFRWMLQHPSNHCLTRCKDPKDYFLEKHLLRNPEFNYLSWFISLVYPSLASVWRVFSFLRMLAIYITFIYAHTHTYIYIYIYKTQAVCKEMHKPGVHKCLQKSQSDLEIPGARRETWSKFILKIHKCYAPLYTI